MSYGKPKNMMGGFVLILKSAWGVLSMLYFWAWGVLSAFKKTCGGFCPPIRKWAWGVLSVGCFVLHSYKPFASQGLHSVNKGEIIVCSDNEQHKCC